MTCVHCAREVLMSAEPRSKLCFVIGPIGDENSDVRIHADWLLELIIEPVMADFPDFRVQRADKLPQPGLIDAQVINGLLTAELVSADLTKLNPNAFYEIGIRHMVQKAIIHMQVSDEKPPFDVSLYRAIKFSLRRPSDLKDAQARLREQVAAVLAEDYVVENPVTNARGRMSLDQHATPDQKVLLEQMRGIQERLSALESAARASNAASRMQIALFSKPPSPPELTNAEILSALARGAQPQGTISDIFRQLAPDPDATRKND
jgi:hypothetical protein